MLTTLTVETPTDREIVMIRIFNASLRMVWDAMTKPDLLRRWLSGPPGWRMVGCEDDLSVGSTFHWSWSGPEGEFMSMRGVYREVVPPQRIVRTEAFEFGCESQAGEKVGTLVLSDHDGGGNGNGKSTRNTRMSLTLLYPSKEARDATVASGM